MLGVLAPAPLGARSRGGSPRRRGRSSARCAEDGRYAEAEPAALEALELSEREFGPDHPEVAIALNDLASLDWTLNRLDQAEGRFRRAREILADAPGDYRAMAMGVLQNLTVLLGERGDSGQVEELYLEALALIEQEHGRSSALYASASGNLGAFYQVQGRNQEAEQRLRESLEIKHQVLAPDDPSIAVGLSNLANLFEVRGARSWPWSSTSRRSRRGRRAPRRQPSRGRLQPRASWAASIAARAISARPASTTTVPWPSTGTPCRRTIRE